MPVFIAQPFANVRPVETQIDPSSDRASARRYILRDGGISHRPSFVSLAAARPIGPAVEYPPASSEHFLRGVALAMIGGFMDRERYHTGQDSRYPVMVQKAKRGPQGV